ncbi:MAG: DUF4145 domain-containing protein, partial [Chthoniobacterales bacterium]
IEMREVLKAEESLEKSTLSQRLIVTADLTADLSVQDESRSLMEQLLEQDPKLALVGLRIEIEKRLAILGKKRNIFFPKPTAISKMIRVLQERGTLDSELAASLSDIVGIGNRAIHGAQVDSNVAKRALGVGRELLSALDNLVEESDFLGGR